MQEIRLNRNLLKVLHRLGEDIETYRFYIIARAAFSHRSGLFTLNELCDLLHTEYSYKSLHRGPGNKRKVYRGNLHERFTASILFRQAPDGRFIASSERRLLVSQKGTDKSSWYLFPDSKTLSSKGAFRDFCIGVLVAGNRFRSNRKVAKYSQVTPRRVQLATAANHKRQTFIKQFNFIDEKTGTKKQIERERALLFHLHGINSPRPVKIKDEWVLRLNAPNTYRSFVLSGVKGFHAQPTECRVRKKECWFKPVVNKFKQPSLFGDEYKRWVFKEGVYNLSNYVQDNSSFLS